MMPNAPNAAGPRSAGHAPVGDASFVTECPQCAARLRVGAGVAGKLVKCPRCATAFPARPSDGPPAAQPASVPGLPGPVAAAGGAAPAERPSRIAATRFAGVGDSSRVGGRALDAVGDRVVPASSPLPENTSATLRTAGGPSAGRLAPTGPGAASMSGPLSDDSGNADLRLPDAGAEGGRDLADPSDLASLVGAAPAPDTLPPQAPSNQPAASPAPPSPGPRSGPAGASGTRIATSPTPSGVGSPLSRSSLAGSKGSAGARQGSGSGKSVARPASDTLVGRTLGQFRIVRPLGRGGMGTVYEATDTQLDRNVALKVLNSDLCGDEEAVQRFVREARTAAKLEHPNVVSIYSVGREGELIWLAMQLVRGGSASDKLRAEGPYPPEEALRVCIESARGLAAAHALGMVHRDIKPANLLLSETGAVKVADFGLAKAAAGGTGQTLTVAGGVVGTPQYMSPEQCQGRPVDARSDLYSLGATLYALLAGRPPYGGDSAPTILYRHVYEPLPDIRRAREDIPAGCMRVIHRAMAKSPDDRYATAEEMVADLEAVDLSEPSFAFEPPEGAVPLSPVGPGEESPGPAGTGSASSLRASAPGSIPGRTSGRTQVGTAGRVSGQAGLHVGDARDPRQTSQKAAARRRNQAVLITVGVAVVVLVGLALAGVFSGKPARLPAGKDGDKPPALANADDVDDPSPDDVTSNPVSGGPTTVPVDKGTRPPVDPVPPVGKPDRPDRRKPERGATMEEYDRLIAEVNQLAAELPDGRGHLSKKGAPRFESGKRWGEFLRAHASDPVLLENPHLRDIGRVGFGLEGAPPWLRFRAEVIKARETRFGPLPAALRNLEIDEPNPLPPEPSAVYKWRPLESVPRGPMRGESEQRDNLYNLFAGDKLHGLTWSRLAAPVLQGDGTFTLKPATVAERDLAGLRIDAGEFADFDLRMRVTLSDVTSNLMVAYRHKLPTLFLGSGNAPRPKLGGILKGGIETTAEGPVVALQRGQVWLGEQAAGKVKPVGGPHRTTAADAREVLMRVVVWHGVVRVWLDGILAFEHADPDAGKAGEMAVIVTGGEVRFREVRLLIGDARSRGADGSPRVEEPGHRPPDHPGGRPPEKGSGPPPVVKPFDRPE